MWFARHDLLAYNYADVRDVDRALDCATVGGGVIDCLHHMHGAPFKAVKSQNPSKQCIQGARLELEQHLTKLCSCLQWSLHPNCQFKLIRNTDILTV